MFKGSCYLFFFLSLLFILSGCSVPTSSINADVEVPVDPYAGGNHPPVASFADADFIVCDSGLNEVNGLFKENGTTGNLLNGPKYEKISGTYYSLYMFLNSDSVPTWAINSSIVCSPAVNEDVTYYIQYPSTLPPDEGWECGDSGLSLPPSVNGYPIYIQKTTQYTIFARYEYSDPDSDPEGSTRYLWYRSPDGVSDWTLEFEGTDCFYETTDGNGYIKIIIIPFDISGNEGIQLESVPVEIDPA